MIVDQAKHFIFFLQIVKPKTETKMKTPIQELIWSSEVGHLKNTEWFDEQKNDIYIKALKQLLVYEEQFAKQCFEAGRTYGMDICISSEWAENPTTPDFDTWYKQFEK